MKGFTHGVGSICAYTSISEAFNPISLADQYALQQTSLVQDPLSCTRVYATVYSVLNLFMRPDARAGVGAEFCRSKYSRNRRSPY
jgi:hypothetical protein